MGIQTHLAIFTTISGRFDWRPVLFRNQRSRRTIGAWRIDGSRRISAMRKIMRFNNALGVTIDDAGPRRECFVRIVPGMTASRRE